MTRPKILLAKRDDPYRRALFLWMEFKTQTSQYKTLADKLGITTLQLNSICHDKWRERQHARDAKRRAIRNN